MRFYLIIFMLFTSIITTAQFKEISGIVLENKTAVPLEGATVILLPGRLHSLTDGRGHFFFKNVDSCTQIQVSSIGHQPMLISLDELAKDHHVITLTTTPVQLNEVIISAGARQQYHTIGKLDLKMRGLNNAQEVLRIVPGLFIGKHAGGGKAEQIFLRGFDLDHGTDINITADGIPVNMVSHAHGQGYADLHFIIPELIDKTAFQKGPYDAEKGNFTTTGFVDVKTLDVLTHSFIKVEGGMHHTFRTVGMLNLLPEKSKESTQSAYLASEFMHTRGYFDHPQNFNRFNVFGKYHSKLGIRNTLSLSASAFSSRWDASGQIPERAVKKGMIGFYGAIDPNEGGKTSRFNANVLLNTVLNNRSYMQNQVYYSNYNFLLHSNFTFFKIDSINGDQIRQKEKRNMFGYNGSIQKTSFAGGTKITTKAGINIRMDGTSNSELSRTKQRDSIIAPLMLGNIAENNIAFYISETFTISPKLSVYSGLRYDYFFNHYLDKTNNHTKRKATASIFSPKLNIDFQPNQSTKLYLSGGKGFHSNDTRVVVQQKGHEILPAAYSFDLGTLVKPSKSLLVHAAIWYLWLDQEFIYVGDEGVVEPGGKTKRYGTELSIRYQPINWFYADVDVNYSYARTAGVPKEVAYLPLSPKMTSAGGLTIKSKPGINTSLRYRFMGDRPANEANSVKAKGYFLTDLVVRYLGKQYEMGLAVENLLNVKWKETQFETESRLKQEPSPISEIHFTPGPPLLARLSFTYKF
jgi:outer membrane receptor protein involved in Fe transport